MEGSSGVAASYKVASNLGSLAKESSMAKVGKLPTIGAFDCKVIAQGC